MTWTAANTRVLVENRALRSYGDYYDSAGGRVPCECCGAWDYPEMHHRRYRSRGGDWRPSNIVALCHSCHDGVTTCHTGWARDMGLAVSQFARPEEVPVRLWYANGHSVLLDNDGGWIKVDNTVHWW